MTHRADVVRGRDVIARWCALAERRLEHLTELFDTGRWRRYHSELAFLENIQEAKSAVEIWRGLSTAGVSRDRSAIDMSLPRIAVSLSRGETLPDQADRPQSRPPQIASELSSQIVSLLPEAKHVNSDEAPS